MSKEEDRAALAALIAGKPVIKVETKPMDPSLSASFTKLGIDKKTQAVKTAKPSGVKTVNPVKVKRPRQPKRNWEAQARYDEEHGTDNGYDPRIEQWKRDWQE